MLRKLVWLSCLAMTGCTTYRDVKEIKLVGFSDDISKGKAVGQIESDDCVFQLFGYNLGTAPDIGRAIANAKTQKKSKITDVAYASNDSGAGSLRYVRDLSVNYDGFNAYIFGKHCIIAKGMGYE